MASDRASFFSRPDTVMRSHLTADELHLLNTNDPQIKWTAPSLVAFVIRHWIQSLLVLAAILLAAFVMLLRVGSGRWTFVITGLMLMVIAGELAAMEVRLFFRTYLRYVITPTRIIRMDGIVDRRSSSIEWSNITDISDHLGVLGQFFDYGNIAIETANENSKFGELLDVPHPRQFLEEMNKARVKKAKTPINEAALKALISLDSLLSEGGLMVEQHTVQDESTDEVRKAWRVSRGPRPAP